MKTVNESRFRLLFIVLFSLTKKMLIPKLEARKQKENKLCENTEIIYSPTNYTFEFDRHCR